MSIARIYQAAPLAIHQSYVIDENASHHLARVLRAAVSDTVIIFNGEGGEYLARIIEINKKNIKVDILEFNAREAESPIHITLAQGIARGEKMDFIIQKAVELGVNQIVPLITERCNVRVSDDRLTKKLAHWQAVMISACEQSGRNRVPKLSVPMTLANWLAETNADYKFTLSPHVQQKIAANKLTKGSSIAILIGPEGGLSDQEVKLSEEKGCLPLNMGPRILRTETAALAAMTLLQALYGDLT